MFREPKSAQSSGVRDRYKSLLYKLRAKRVGVTVLRLKDGHMQPCELYLEKSGGGGVDGRGYEEVR